MSGLVFTPVLHPSLGSTSTRPPLSPIRFHALMHIIADKSTVVDPGTKFTVLLWYSKNGRGTWKPAQFREAEFGDGLVDAQRTVEHRRDHFVLDLEYDAAFGPLQFCLKYRFGEGPWLWAGSRIGGLDGRIVFDSWKPRNFSHIFDLSDRAGWKARLIEEGGNCQIWDVSCFNRTEGVLNLPLGKAISPIEQWVALVKIASPWMGPQHGKKIFSIDKDALLVAFQRAQDGGHVVLLPVSGLGDGTTYITSDPDGLSEFIVRSMGDHEHASSGEKRIQLIIGFGDNVLNTVAAAVAYLKKWVRSGSNSTSSEPSIPLGDFGLDISEGLEGHLEQLRSLVRREWYQGSGSDPSKEAVSCDLVLEMLAGLAAQRVGGGEFSTRQSVVAGALAIAKSLGEGLGRFDIGGPPRDNKVGPSKRTFWEDGVSYCTWNGLGWDLSESRILQALRSLEGSGIAVSNLIIDDNWQTLAGRNYGSSGTWSSFEANEKFPGGLKGLVKKIRECFPYIKHIGVWHALHGYWDGITPDSALAKGYKTIDVSWNDNVNSTTKMLTMIAPEDIGRFYDDFYRFLSDCGIDSVKTDVQCRIDELTSERDKARLSRAYQVAFKQSSTEYFDRRVIYCMSHVPLILYNSLLPDGGPRPFLRTSDDFYPDVPQSHTWHIFANAMNMVLFSQLNILPDWDMFQTSLPDYASLHAAARCLSGGPIFITDSPDSHNIEVISSMVSMTPSPNSPMRALRPDRMAHAVDPYLGYRSNRLLCIQNMCSKGATHLLGVFNLASVGLTEIVGSFWPKDGNWVVWGHRSGRVESVGADLLVVDLEMWGWEVFTASQVYHGVAVLGLKENITGAAAIVGWSLRWEDVYKVIEVEMRALGKLVVYVEGLQEGQAKSCSFTICGSQKALMGSSPCFNRRTKTLELDLVGVWGVECGNADSIKVLIKLGWESDQTKA